MGDNSERAILAVIINLLEDLWSSEIRVCQSWQTGIHFSRASKVNAFSNKYNDWISLMISTKVAIK